MENQSNFDKARELAFDDSGALPEIVEHSTAKGTARYEVRPLSLEDQRIASQWATVQRMEKRNGKDVVVREEEPHTKGAAMAIIGTFDPDTGKALFNKADLPLFMKNRDHRLFAKLITAAGRVNAVESVEEAAGNSESAPTDTLFTN